MSRGHTPYGYRIENGAAVIHEEEAAQIRKMYKGYLGGLSLVASAAEAGITMKHSSAKRMMQNSHLLGDDFYPAIIDQETYVLGDDFYPAIIDQETYDAFEAERQRREKTLGRNKRKKKTMEARPEPTAFRMRKPVTVNTDPYKQAEYLYSLIESEV